MALGLQAVRLQGDSKFNSGWGYALPVLNYLITPTGFTTPTWVAIMARRPFSLLHLMWQLWPILERESLLHSHSGHNSHLVGLLQCDLLGAAIEEYAQLQLVQNTAVQVAMDSYHYSHITPMVWKPHWLPTLFQVQIKMLVAHLKLFEGLNICGSAFSQ